MTQVIRGTGADLAPYLEKYQDRGDLTLSIPDAARDSASSPTPAEIAAANARLRRHIVKLPFPVDLNNDQIDADLAREYAGQSSDE